MTAAFIAKCAGTGLYDGATFYRSDFVIQCGLYGSGKANPFGDLPANETITGVRVGNTRGTAAIAHFDVPDNGNTEVLASSPKALCTPSPHPKVSLHDAV